MWVLIVLTVYIAVCERWSKGGGWTVLNTQRSHWVQTKTAHHDPWAGGSPRLRWRWRARGCRASRSTSPDPVFL